MGIAGKFRNYSRRVCRTPLLCIEWVVVLTGVITGLYMISPVYTLGNKLHPSPLGMVLNAHWMIALWGVTLLIGCTLVIIGIIRNNPRLRSPGWFLVLLARTYQFIATFVVIGIIPLQWLLPLTLALIVLILWAKTRVEVRHDTR